MSVFRFKRFEVVNERSAMKVNTDGVLLGAAMTIMPEDRRFLDIGTGTGTIALMVAQRSFAAAQDDKESAQDDKESAQDDKESAQDRSDLSQVEGVPVILNEVKNLHIDAIDIDEASASEAAANFDSSPWNASLHAHHCSLDEFAKASDGMYDLIFSNPPYFEASLTAPDERKSTARHTSEGLSYRDIFDFAAGSLAEKGRVSFVLPADQEASLCRYARMSGFHLFRILRIRTVPRKQPARIIAEFARERCAQPSDSILTIQDEGKYTQEYLSLTHDFYLFA